MKIVVNRKRLFIDDYTIVIEVDTNLGCFIMSTSTPLRKNKWITLRAIDGFRIYSNNCFDKNIMQDDIHIRDIPKFLYKLMKSDKAIDGVTKEIIWKFLK